MRKRREAGHTEGGVGREDKSGSHLTELPRTILQSSSLLCLVSKENRLQSPPPCRTSTAWSATTCYTPRRMCRRGSYG